MSLAEIETELEGLTPEELRHVALKAWQAFVAKEASGGFHHECSEEDSALLAALDEAISGADAAPGQGCSGSEVRRRLEQWISK